MLNVNCVVGLGIETLEMGSKTEVEHAFSAMPKFDFNFNLLFMRREPGGHR